MRVEGRDSDDWMAVNLGQSPPNQVPNTQEYLIINSSSTHSTGSAVVHMMLDDTRRRYELEKLWALGPQYDDQFRDMQEWFQTTDIA